MMNQIRRLVLGIHTTIPDDYNKSFTAIPTDPEKNM